MILIKNEEGTRAKCKVVSACCYPDSHNGTSEEVFDRHNDHHLSNERQNINEYTCRSRYDIRKPKIKPIYLGYFNPSFFFCKGINNYNVVFIKQV
jgi:hypothetical protein